QEFRERMEVIKHRWREYHAKKAQLEADKQRSEEILKENSEMQIRALKKINQGREEKMHAERELLRAKELLEDLKNKHRKLSNSVQKYSIFNKYLEDVVKISEFETIEDIIGRYETLQSVRNELLQSQQKQKEKSEETKVFLDQYMKEKEAEMLQYENELVQLQQRLEKARSDALYWETRWDDIQNASLKKTQELGTIKLAILNLFQ
ncbi:CCD42 protein, partial [Nycticryphes semicollaris]|nr:CCD42 protein [Nycticryphes semicollaris]